MISDKKTLLTSFHATATLFNACFCCLFSWAHQVRSYSRNIAVNIWWTVMRNFNHSDCAKQQNLQGKSLNHFEFTHGEQVRYIYEKWLAVSVSSDSQEKNNWWFMSETCVCESFRHFFLRFLILSLLETYNGKLTYDIMHKMIRVSLGYIWVWVSFTKNPLYPFNILSTNTMEDISWMKR